MSTNDVPFCSIITICFNEADTIDKTCKSIAQLESEEYEWIVIDGGSTDGTLGILREYANEIAILVSEPDSGIYNAMNKGAALASGDFLLFMNGGDYFYGNEVLEQVAAVDCADVIVADVMLGDEAGDVLRYPDALSSRWLRKKMLPHQAAFIRRATFERCGRYNEDFRIAGDYEMFVRLFRCCGASYHHVPIIAAVFGRGGISQSSEHRALRKRENHCVRWHYFPSYRFSFRALREAIRLARSDSTCPPPTLAQKSNQM